MGVIHYVSYYLGPGEGEHRQAVPAGFAKIEYIAQVARDAGFDVRVVSTAMAKSGRVPGRRDGSHVYLSSWRPRGWPGFVVASLFAWVQLLRYLLVDVQRDDTVLVYHSLNYLSAVRFAQRIKKFRLVLELNDLYHAVSAKHAFKAEAEESFIRSADAYLMMNGLAARRFADGKPHALSFGSYEVPARSVEAPTDVRTHVVYAGIVEPGRRAAELAARSAAHLDERFVVHILGFGTPESVASLEDLVAEVNERAGRTAAIFHGTLRGRDFTDFLHGCHIGLSSHAYRPDEAESADYTFPSKIPQYAAHDLRVVSPAIPCVVDSPFAECATFYDEHTPEAIAGAIVECAAGADGPRSPAALVAELDQQFRADLPRVLGQTQAGSPERM